MGGWSEFFEDFPEYAPAPPSADEIAEEKQRKIESEIRQINSDAFSLIQKAKENEKNKYLDFIECCPQCGEQQLNVYKLSQIQFLCECQECNTYGAGSDVSIAIQKIIDAYGDDLNWKNDSLFESLRNKK